jgi:hypothetical protein
MPRTPVRNGAHSGHGETTETSRNSPGRSEEVVVFVEEDERVGFSSEIGNFVDV